MNDYCPNCGGFLKDYIKFRKPEYRINALNDTYLEIKGVYTCRNCGSRWLDQCEISKYCYDVFHS